MAPRDRPSPSFAYFLSLHLPDIYGATEADRFDDIQLLVSPSWLLWSVQICVGESECTDKSFKYEPQYYVSELEALVSHLGLQEGGFHLLGHSWGTVIAELYSSKQPRGLRGLVLAGGISEARRYVQGQWEDIWGDAPPAVEEFILKTEETRDYDNPLYGPVAEGLGTKFTYRTVPAPDCLADALAGLNPDVYVKIQGAIGAPLIFMGATCDSCCSRAPCPQQCLYEIVADSRALRQCVPAC